MRITRDFLINFTKESIVHRAKANHDLLAAYLFGSFLGDAFTLGGAGDIDIVLIYGEAPAMEREFVRITDEIHLDIVNHLQQDYRDTRQVRIDPWFGPILNACKILHDPQHYLDFIQASVRGQFDRPDHVYQRARLLADKSRETWFHLQADHLGTEPDAIRSYLSAVEGAANAVAILSGPPLSERRLLLDFASKAEDQGRPGLQHGLLGLLGSSHFMPERANNWTDAWEEAFLSLPDERRPVRFHPARLRYYLDAFKALLNSEQANRLLFPLLDTWSELAARFPEGTPQRSAWQQALEELGLYGPGLIERVAGLDAFLDTVDETLESWAQQNGV